MRVSGLFVLLLSAAVTVAGWRVFSHAESAPAVEGPLHGVTYAPYGKDQDATIAESLSQQQRACGKESCEARSIFAKATDLVETALGLRVQPPAPEFTPADAAKLKRHRASVELIERDMQVLAGRVTHIRTYSSIDGVEEVPRIAAKYGIKVIAGAWVNHVEDKSRLEIASLIRLVHSNPNIERVIVGNETVLRWRGNQGRIDLNPDRLLAYVREVKRNVKVPVSVAEDLAVWLDFPQLAREVDYIAVHLLPYWEPGSAEDPLPLIKEQLTRLRQQYPRKNIVVTEVGWPSNGPSREVRSYTKDENGIARETRRTLRLATPAEQAKRLREMVDWLNKEGIEYYVIEAFDQPWKSAHEGLVGSYWGIFDADRQAKIDWTGSIRAFPDWWKVALANLLLALPAIAFFLWRFPEVSLPGQAVMATVTTLSGAAFAYAGYAAAGIYMTWLQIIGWSILGLFLFASLAMAMQQAGEMVEIIWRRKWKREITPAMAQRDAALDRQWPMVSLHLAICNEPPAMVQQTLDSLAALDYPALEVIVIDNNTRDPAIWRPVEEYCKSLGPRFRFFHFDEMKGFKAGALNYVLSQTNPEAQVIGVIDSDYVVRADWLKCLVPQFDDPRIGYVQAPQDHRDWREDRFKAMLQWEYAGFFDLGMSLRNEYDALIQHGTMTLIRRKLMDDLGGWATWCICEDSEFGLRAMEQGYGAAYSRERFGQGLTPDNFSGYKKQRFRWAYGAMQILKGHWRSLVTNRTRLSIWQKYHFAVGWLPWMADALNVVFTLLGIVWAAGVLLLPQWIFPPPQEFLIPTLGIFVFKLIHTFSLYAARVDCTWRQSLGASLAGLSLTYTVGRAVIYGLLTSRLPFIRTPKLANRATIGLAFAMARGEAILTLLLWIAAGALYVMNGHIDPAMRVWALLLVVQSLPYVAALYVSVVNALSHVRFEDLVALAEGARDTGPAPLAQPAQ